MDILGKLLQEFDNDVPPTEEQDTAANFVSFARTWLTEHRVQGIGRGANGETLLIDGESFDILPEQATNMAEAGAVPITQPQNSAVRSHPQQGGEVPITQG